METAWRRVTITHARHRELAEQVRQLLEFSGYAPAISEDPSAGLPGVGAAVVFDERRIILLAPGEVAVPDALRGVAVVRFTGKTLDSPATDAFLSAINGLNTIGPIARGAGGSPLRRKG